MKRLVVDNRWRGEHGIGRFATEVLRRLSADWEPLGGDGSPTSMTDLVHPGRVRLASTDVVYSPGFNAGVTAAKQILTLHDLIHLQVRSESSFAKSAYYNTLVRWAVRRAGVVMTVSTASAEVIRKWLRSPDVKIEVVGCGQSVAFRPDGPRERFERDTFVYVGNLKPHKNVDVVLEALRLRPDYDLILVTSDVETATQRIAESGLTGRVHVRSGVSDDQLATLYRGATGVVQPSILEGFGLPALESLGCGTRVAYWQGCASVAEICAGEGVAVSDAASVAGWAEALDQLRTDAARGPIQMPAAWVARYTWDAVAAKVERVLQAARS
jgi:glycosyltransferase involved in cell wall biosynthesis